MRVLIRKGVKKAECAAVIRKDQVSILPYTAHPEVRRKGMSHSSPLIAKKRYTTATPRGARPSLGAPRARVHVHSCLGRKKLWG